MARETETFESGDQNEDLKNGDGKNTRFPHVNSENKYTLMKTEAYVFR